MFSRTLGTCLTLSLLCLIAAPLANSTNRDYIPPELEPWVDWVLELHPEINCPRIATSAGPSVGKGNCTWVSNLDLKVTNRAINFDLKARTYAAGMVVLPGTEAMWPTAVKVNGAVVPVVRAGNQPAVQLAAGQHRISGSIATLKRPDNLLLPQQFGLLSLRINDRVVQRPTVRGRQLFLGERKTQAVAGQPESLQVEVFRQLVDGVPMFLNTFVRLQVSGSARVESLGQVLLADFEVVGLQSPLPARLQNNGDLQVQVEPGEHLIMIGARATKNLTELSSNQQTANWPSQEVWAFQPNRTLRLVNVAGGSGVDLDQVDTPFNGEGLQGFLLNADQSFQLTEQQRGDPNPAPGEISLQRDLWLNFDGSGYVVRDQVQAQLRRAARLSASYSLGSVAVDGTNELITQLADGNPGIELSAGQHSLTSISAVPRSDQLSATGWHVDANHLSATLHLPPGWRLLWATGSDEAPTAWLARWTLWDLFVVILTLVLAWRYFGVGFTALLAITLLFAYQQSAALAITWLVLLCLLVVLRHLDHERLAGLLRLVTASIAFFAVLGALGIAVDHARQGLHPQLSHYSTGGIDMYGVGSTAPLDEMMEMQPATPSFEPQADMSKSRRSLEGHSQAIEEVIVTASKGERQKYPEGMQVQTGPGIPGWTWDQAPLRWHGPVTSEQPLNLTLMSPPAVRVWHWFITFSVLLVTGLLLLPLMSIRPNLPGWLKMIAPRVESSSGSTAIGLGLGALLVMSSLLMMATPNTANAASVDPQILKELEQRLLKAPQCEPGCASLGTARINVGPDQLELTLEVHTAAFVAVPLPGSTQNWSPSLVEVDGEAAVLANVSQGKHLGLSAALTPGVHQVRMRGSLAGLQQAELVFALKPALVLVNSHSNWRVQGLRNQRLARQSLTLTRAETVAKTAEQEQKQTLQPATAPAYVTVERSFSFDLDWRIHTQVTRIAPEQGSFSVSIPLVEGEAVLNNDINVSKNAAMLVFGARQNRIQWQSTLAKSESLQLAAPEVSQRQEIWSFTGSNLWHLHFAPADNLVASTIAGRAGPVFYPRTNERLVVRPEATQPLKGASITIHAAELTETPGERIRSSELQLTIQTSQGGDYPIVLPDGAELAGVRINGDDQPIGLREGKVDLPLLTGEAEYAINWRSPLPGSYLFRTEQLRLPGDISNINLVTRFPADRWVLAVGGPRLGPAVLFWGVFIVVALVGLLVARIPNMPFRSLDALLLAAGLTLCNFPSAVLVVLWVLALRARMQWVEKVQRTWVLNLIQVGTGVLSVAAIIGLVSSVPLALLGSPDMQIAGNGSNAYFFRWFADHAVQDMPTAWVFSVPLWVYRLAMLIWSLWLAFALMRWLRWAWVAWSKPQVWYSKRTA